MTFSDLTKNRELKSKGQIEPVEVGELSVARIGRVRRGQPLRHRLVVERREEPAQPLRVVRPVEHAPHEVRGTEPGMLVTVK